MEIDPTCHVSDVEHFSHGEIISWLTSETFVTEEWDRDIRLTGDVDLADAELRGEF
jgi:hypothetical protein